MSTEAMPAEASSSTGSAMSHLPWQQIPKFVPGVTDVEDYTKRMEFLKELWPAEHLALLGPRAALQVEGSAFQKVRRIAPDKLRGTDGVKLLVEALGGSWGRTAVEDKYYHFEQAMFQTNQKADESNDSYIARHDVHFEELISKNVTIEEIRAYVLLRHSQLSAEDKKRVVVEAQGNLSYANTVKAVRLLGSKFFTELQGRGTSAAGRPAERQKVYETNFTEEEVGEYDADINFAADSEDDLWVAHMCEMGDEDAIYVAEFEDQIIEAVQDSELAPIYSAYQEARLKLKEKAKARGFWPKGHGKGGGKYGSSRKGRGKSGPRYKTLADRIANSTCRRCGQQGHWKRECPRNADNQRNEVSNFTQAAMEEEDLPEILQTLPDGAEDFEMITEHPGQARTGHAARQSDERIQYSCHFPCLLMATPKVSVGSRVKEVIARRLLMLDRTTRHQKTSRTPAPGNPLPEDCILGKGPSLCSSSSSHFGRTCPETVLVVTEGSEGVLDTGASRTVVGLERLQEVLQGLSERCRKGIKRVSSEITFRFGNSGTLSSKYALLLPSSSGSWVRLEVIPGHTPLLISNKLLREMDAVIHVRKGFVQVGQVWVPTRFDERGLSLVDLASLLQCTPEQACLTASGMSRKHHKHEPATPVGIATEHLPATRSLDNSCPPAQPTSALTLRSCPADPTPSQAGHAGDPQASAFRVQSLSGGSGPRPSLVGGGERRAGGRPVQPSHVQGRHLQQASWDRESAPMGRHHSAGGQTQRELSRGNLQLRFPLLDHYGSQDHSHQCLEPELCQLRGGTAQDGGQSSQAKDDQGEDRGLRERGLGHCGNRPGDGLREEGPKQSQAKDDGEAHHPKDVEGDKLEHDRGRDHRDGEDDDCYAQGAPTPGAGDSGAVAAAAEQSRRRRGRGLGVKQQSAKATTMGEDIQKLCGQIDHKIKTIEGQLLEGAGHVIHETASRYRLPSLDVLEIAPKVGNMVSAAVQKCGGRALCLKGHQLDSAKGSCGRLRQIFDMYQPTHVWIDVRQPWLGTRSRDSKDWWPWRVLLDLYHSQIESGRHFHMCCGPQFFEEAPPEFAEIQQGMLMAVHNPQELEGHKKVPTGNNFYRRRTIIHTTSRAIQQALDTRPAVTEPQRPSSSHNHDKPQRKHLLQQSLGTRAAPALLSNGGLPLLLSELLLGEGSRELPQEDLEAARQVLKRRRLWGKQSPPEQNAESSGASEAVTWERIFTEVNDRVPKGGGMAVEEGDAITSMVQQLLPDFQVQQVVFCRGTNRVQPPKGSWVGKDIPLRQTVVVRRDNGKVELDGALEEWTKVPRYKQCRAIIPARMSATVYGIQLNDPYVQPVHRSESSGSDEGPEMQIDDPAGSAVEVGAPEGLVQGFPPKMIPRHGPGFLGLNEEERGTIMRLHNNLGHPSPELFAKFLGERKAEPEMIRAARDYSCSVCQETVSLPKLSRPSAVHVDGDFGDTIGMDVAYWTNSAGKTFMFTHVLDEATLFEQAEATGRTQQEQFEVLADHWFRWAGPCKTLYVDPAGEYTGDQWRDRLQQEGIQAHVSAGKHTGS